MKYLIKDSNNNGLTIVPNVEQGKKIIKDLEASNNILSKEYHKSEFKQNYSIVMIETLDELDKDEIKHLMDINHILSIELFNNLIEADLHAYEDIDTDSIVEYNQKMELLNDYYIEFYEKNKTTSVVYRLRNNVEVLM